MQPQDLDKRFNYHPAVDAATIEAHQAVRAGCRDLSAIFDTVCPEGREKSLAVTRLEEAMMWANAAIARHNAPTT